jgi:hypothetical protein
MTTMAVRKPHRWTATVQEATGNTKEVEIESHWEPTDERTPEAIAHAAAVQEWYGSHPDPKQRMPHAPIAATLIEEPEEVENVGLPEGGPGGELDYDGQVD